MKLMFKQFILLSRVILTVIFMLVETSCSSAQQPSLFDSGWVLESINGGKETLPDSVIYLSFRRDQIWGFAGCNGIAAQMESAKVDGHSLKLVFVRTLIGCSNSKFEDKYIDFLDQAASYETDGKSLTLFDESGQLLLTYRRDDKYLKPSPTLTPATSTP